MERVAHAVGTQMFYRVIALRYISPNLSLTLKELILFEVNESKRQSPEKRRPNHLYGWVYLEVEPSRIELLSRLGITLPLIHRFSPSNPQGGNHLLSRMMGFSDEVFASKSTRDNLLAHPLGFVCNP